MALQQRDILLKRFASAVKHTPGALERLQKMFDITLHCTSESAFELITEMYSGNMVRFRAIGTRSQFTLSYDILKEQKTRKPSRVEPCIVYNDYGILSYDFYKAYDSVK